MPQPKEEFVLDTTAAPEPACVLVHRESDDLVQLRLDGNVASGRLTVARATGSLDREPTGRRADLARLGYLARRGKAGAGVVDCLASARSS